MSSSSICLELDAAIDVVIRRHNAAPPVVSPALRGLLDVASELRHIPRPDFKARLMADLQRQVARPVARPQLCSPVRPYRELSSPMRPVVQRDILPTLLGASGSPYPVDRSNLVASFVLHAAALAAIATSSFWFVGDRTEIRSKVVAVLTEPSMYPMPVAPDKTGGGGGGGDRDRLPASKGTPPRFAHEQFTPPAVVIRDPDPKLAVEPTVVGPPTLKFSQTAETGDPLSAIVGPPSNGTGTAGGIGNGTGGGVGSGFGPGVGPGSGGGIGGGVYRVGGGVSAPRATYAPDPEYSEEARKAKYQGTVVLWVVVAPDGRVHDVRLQRSLGMGLDEKAIEAVRKWTFEPSRKDGQPVAVQVNIEVSFRLY